MTVSGTTLKNIYTLNESTTVFPYTFKILQDSDMVVTLFNTSTGAETLLTLTTDYTVSGAGNDSGTRNVTYAGASSYDSTYKLILQSGVPYTQPTDYEENDDFLEETHELALDRLAIQIRQVKEQADRAVVLNISETTGATFPSASANALIGWNSTATALENKTMMDANAQAAAELAADEAQAAAAEAEVARAAAVVAQEAAEAVAGFEAANEAEAQAGVDNTKFMTPRRTDDYFQARLVDEDDMASNSATKVPTQQSVKAYVDGSIGISGVYDSGWFAIATSKSYAKTHNLGTTKVNCTILFSTSSNGSNAFSMTFEGSTGSGSQGSHIGALSTTSVSLYTGANKVFVGVNGSGADVTYASGYARIILTALA